MDVSLFDFDLPEERIALRPASPRDSARLMVVAGGRPHRPSQRARPAGLSAGGRCAAGQRHQGDSGAAARPAAARRPVPAKIEILLHRRLSADRFRVLARPARKLAAGDALAVRRTRRRRSRRAATMAKRKSALPLSGAALDAAIAAQGEMPLPPYIAGKRKAGRARCRATIRPSSRAQTARWPRPRPACISRRSCSPRWTRKGVARETVTLHVGPGHLPAGHAPMTPASIACMPSAPFWTPHTAARLNAVHAAGGRIAAVGTTVLAHAGKRGGRRTASSTPSTAKPTSSSPRAIAFAPRTCC